MSTTIEEVRAEEIEEVTGEQQNIIRLPMARIARLINQIDSYESGFRDALEKRLWQSLQQIWDEADPPFEHEA